MQRRLPAILTLVLFLTALATPAVAGPADWPAYLFGPKHPSKSASTAITPANVGALAKAWTFTSPGPTLSGRGGPDRCYG